MSIIAGGFELEVRRRPCVIGRHSRLLAGSGRSEGPCWRDLPRVRLKEKNALAGRWNHLAVLATGNLPQRDLIAVAFNAQSRPPRKAVSSSNQRGRVMTGPAACQNRSIPEPPKTAARFAPFRSLGILAVARRDCHLRVNSFRSPYFS